MQTSIADNCLLSLLEGFYTPRGASLPVCLDEARWEEIAARAKKLDVAPLLYYRLKNSGFDVPADVFNGLHAAAHTNALRNRMMYATVKEPLFALHEAGIPAIVLKGIYLAEAVYANIALRPMKDADILVRQHDIGRVEELLSARGFDPPEHPRIRGHREFRVALHRPGGASIEVHWILDKPGSPFLIDHEGLWDRARPASICGAQALCLCPEDLLLHLCWQAMVNKQLKKGLYPFFDMHAVINCFGDRLDWDAFVLRAQQWRLSNCVYGALALTQDFFGSNIPPRVLAGLQGPETHPEIIGYARDLVFSPPAFSSKFLQLASLPSLREKLLLLKQVLFPWRHTIIKKYRLRPHTRLAILYYPAYWTYLAVKYAALVLKMIRRDYRVAPHILSQRKQDRVQEWLSGS